MSYRCLPECPSEQVPELSDRRPRDVLYPTVFPKIVSASEWQQAYDAFLVKQKELTRAKDALAAERRRLPMVKVEKSYTFDGAEGPVTLLDLFAGQPQRGDRGLSRPGPVKDQSFQGIRSVHDRGSRNGGPCRSRTYDQEIKSLLLYQLS